jgi:4-hydroxy-tetrahydrodipicolinate synthase
MPNTMTPFTARYAGSWPVMVTPFDAGLALDLGAYRAMIAWYLEHSVGGLYANCLSSEMYDLDDDERVALVREAVRAAAGRAPVAATGNLGEDVAAHVRLCRRVAEAGADVVMLVAPPFFGDDGALERYFSEMADAVDAPLGLYECPVPRPYHLGMPLVRKLAQSGRFVAYKETSCDLAKIRSLAEVVRGTPMSLLQANVPYLVEATRAGAPGSMSVAAIIVPELVAEVIAAARSGSPTESLHARLCAIHLAQRQVHPHGSKYLLAKRGVPIATHARQQPSPLSAEVLAALDHSARHWFEQDGSLRGDASRWTV